MSRTLTITVDLDGPPEYGALHGLDLRTVSPTVMFEAPLTRFTDACRTAGGFGTLFAIGRDVTTTTGPNLKRLVEQGFEIASHSQDHDYGLSRRPLPAILANLREAHTRLAEATGQAPQGFRAPGYNLSPALVEALTTLGLSYDASVLPSPPYYLLKTAVMALYHVQRRQTAAILGSPTSLWAPRTPYHPGTSPYRPGRRSLVELPITVATRLRIPVTGAALLLAPRWLCDALLADLNRQPIVLLNLHTMDVADIATEGFPAALAARQPELKRSLDERLTRLHRILTTLSQGRDVLTCAQLAERLRAANTARA